MLVRVSFFNSPIALFLSAASILELAAKVRSVSEGITAYVDVEDYAPCSPGRDGEQGFTTPSR